MSDNLIDEFLKSSQRIFSFLQNYGFELTDQERIGNRYACLYYSNSSINLKINFDSYSFEMGFDLKNNIYNQDVSLSDVIKFFKYEKILGFLSPQFSDKNKCKAVLKKVADFLLNHDDLFNADSSMWNSFFDTKKQEYNNDSIELIRSDIETAWRNKDYHKFLSTLDTVDKKSLSKYDIKRVEFCKKHLKK